MLEYDKMFIFLKKKQSSFQEYEAVFVRCDVRLGQRGFKYRDSDKEDFIQHIAL